MAAGAAFLTLAEAGRQSTDDPALAALAQWLLSYPMQPHPDLGRAGAVCPYIRPARRLDTIRIGLCRVSPEDEDGAAACIGAAFHELERIPASRGAKQFRTVLIGFSDCNTPAGLAMLQRAQRRHKYRAVIRFRMMGLMHPRSDSPGLWNRISARCARPCPRSHSAAS